MYPAQWKRASSKSATRQCSACLRWHIGWSRALGTSSKFLVSHEPMDDVKPHSCRIILILIRTHTNTSPTFRKMCSDITFHFHHSIYLEITVRVARLLSTLITVFQWTPSLLRWGTQSSTFSWRCERSLCVLFASCLWSSNILCVLIKYLYKRIQCIQTDMAY